MDASVEIWIAVWFFGSIILAISAAVIASVRKLFLIYIGMLSLCLILPAAAWFVIPARVIWTLMRKKGDSR